MEAQAKATQSPACTPILHNTPVPSGKEALRGEKHPEVPPALHNKNERQNKGPRNKELFTRRANQ